MNIFANQNCLFIAPHTDDVELGAGATLSRCVNECERVDVVVFSTAIESLPTGSPADRLKYEFYSSMEKYGIPIENLHVLNFPVRRLNYFRQEILDELIILKNQFSPTIVFTPAMGDVHQDHECVTYETIRAFKSQTIFGYELPWNHFQFQSRVYFEITEKHLDTKIEALRSYESQVEKKRPYFDPAFTLGQARMHGVKSGYGLAEAFDLITLKIPGHQNLGSAS